MPRWNTISISGYHIREAGSDAVQEVAFTLADGIAYVDAARAAGLDVDAFAPRLSFFFNAHANLLEEIAKFRAARRLWARIMHDRFGAKDPRSQMLRFHAQTAGSTLTAEQPLNNVVRTTIEALAAVLGGAQSLHTNGYDEALALPTEASARVALRTQQILADETGVANVVDPVGGAYAVEALTSEIEARADGADRGDRSARRHARRDRGGLPAARDRAARRRAPARGRSRRARRRRREPLRRRGARGAAAAAPPGSGARGRADRAPDGGPRRSATEARRAPRSMRWRRRRAGPTTWSRRSSRPSRRVPRWAKSPTCCATSSGNTAPRDRCRTARCILDCTAASRRVTVVRCSVACVGEDGTGSQHWTQGERR